MRGQQLFLASSVLQDVLLPWLSAADFVRLGSTCRDLQAWVMSLSLDQWQVIPRVIASCELTASSKCTQAIR